MACKPKIFTIWPLRKKFADLYRETRRKEEENVKSLSKIIPHALLWPLMVSEPGRMAKQIEAVNSELHMNYSESEG